MSQKNIEVVERWFHSFTEDGDVFRSTLHSDIEWYPFEDNHSPAHGIEGGMAIRNGWLDAWDEMQAEMEQIVSQGDGVVASIHVTGRGRSSGAEVDVRLYMLFRVRDEKVSYVYEYTDRADALEAIGLPADLSSSA
jgi:ketosteroid isomerase-like protein